MYLEKTRVEECREVRIRSLHWKEVRRISSKEANGLACTPSELEPSQQGPEQTMLEPERKNEDVKSKSWSWVTLIRRK